MNKVQINGTEYYSEFIDLIARYVRLKITTSERDGQKKQEAIKKISKENKRCIAFMIVSFFLAAVLLSIGLCIIFLANKDIGRGFCSVSVIFSLVFIVSTIVYIKNNQDNKKLLEEKSRLDKVAKDAAYYLTSADKIYNALLAENKELIIPSASECLIHSKKYYVFSKLHNKKICVGEKTENIGLSEFVSLNDDMTGVEFEDICCKILEFNGFRNIKKTPASGDKGVDILANKDGILYAIQCKFYSSVLGNNPIQEIFAGSKYYCADKAIVMTNSFFTKGAIELAKTIGVELWDYNYTSTLLSKAKTNSVRKIQIYKEALEDSKEVDKIEKEYDSLDEETKYNFFIKNVFEFYWGNCYCISDINKRSKFFLSDAFNKNFSINVNPNDYKSDFIND